MFLRWKLLIEVFFNLPPSTENYREQSKYDNHLIGKVALFQFVNSFLSLFYIAFYLRDQEQLKEVRQVKCKKLSGV